MKATEPTKSFGAIIGKAMGGLDKGKGMIAVLFRSNSIISFFD